MPADPVEAIFAAFAERGADHYGEHVSQLDHALQTAALMEQTAHLLRDSQEMRDAVFRSIKSDGDLVDQARECINRSRATLNRPLLYPYANRRSN